MLRSKVLDSLLLFILRMFLVQLIVAVSFSPSEFLVFIWFICSLWNYYSCSRDETHFKDAGILFGLNTFFVLWVFGYFWFICLNVWESQCWLFKLSYHLLHAVWKGWIFFFPVAWLNPWFSFRMCSSDFLWENHNRERHFKSVSGRNK